MQFLDVGPWGKKHRCWNLGGVGAYAPRLLQNNSQLASDAIDLQNFILLMPLQMQIQTMYMDNEKQLPCKLYDVPGITWQTKVEDIEEIIDIIMKPDCNVSTSESS